MCDGRQDTGRRLAVGKIHDRKQQQIEFGQLVGDIPPLTDAARDPQFLDYLPYNELFVELTEGTSGQS